MARGDQCHRRWQRHKQLLGALAAVVGLATNAAAQSATPSSASLGAPTETPLQAPAEPPLSCADVTLALARAALTDAPAWETHLSGCQKDADFLATLGQRMNRLGRYAEAAEHLERALLLDAARQDVQMAYAFALLGLGDASSARGYLQDLLKDQDLPPALRTQIERQASALAAPTADGAAPPASWNPRLSLSARYGHDSNLLSTPNLSNLSLTVAGQSLSLPLDESYLARAGNYGRADLQLEISRDVSADQRWELVAGVRQRTSPDEARSNNKQIDLLLEQSTPSGGFYWQTQFTDLDASNGVHYQVWGLGAGLSAQKIGSCGTKIGLETQKRDYFSANVLSGRYTGYAASASCAMGSQNRLLLSLRSGEDQPLDASRPGGAQTSTSLRAVVYARLAAWGDDALLLDLEAALQQDTTGYSPILEGGAVRNQRRSVLRLEYQKAFSGGLQWQLGLERQAQDSNLELFRSDNSGAYTSLRWVW